MLHKSEPESFGIITMDYKMKYEPKRYRQKSTDWYGRMGMSWHGTVVSYKPRNVEISTVGVNGAMKNLYIDHICRNDSNQTAYAVASIMELLCRVLQSQIPSMITVVLRSDNAANYNNKLVPVIAPFIFKRYGIQLKSIVHSETKDGKGPADIHFATAAKFVDRYIESKTLDVVTPADLVASINHGEGMKGCIGELFDVDNDCDSARLWYLL